MRRPAKVAQQLALAHHHSVVLAKSLPYHGSARCQKITASSFAAVRRTLRRRILMLTLHEAIPKDQELDIDAREQILKEARELIHDEFEVARDSIGLGHVDAILAELRVKLRGEADRVDGGRGSVMHVFSPAVVVVASLAMGASRLCSGAGGRR